MIRGQNDLRTIQTDGFGISLRSTNIGGNNKAPRNLKGSNRNLFTEGHEGNEGWNKEGGSSPLPFPSLEKERENFIWFCCVGAIFAPRSRVRFPRSQPVLCALGVLCGYKFCAPVLSFGIESAKLKSIDQYQTSIGSASLPHIAPRST